MANPPITIGPFTNVPAPGSPIQSAWPQQITTAVVNATQAITDNWNKGRSAIAAASIVPAGNVDNISSGFTDWLTGASLAVPAGISRALILTTVAGHYIVNADAIYEMAIHFGGLPQGKTAPYSGTTASGRAISTWMSEFVNPPPGNTSVAVMARRAFGSGTLRADVSSWVQFTAFYVFAA
jgi:hypothetical protein